MVNGVVQGSTDRTQSVTDEPHKGSSSKSKRERRLGNDVHMASIQWIRKPEQNWHDPGRNTFCCQKSCQLLTHLWKHFFGTRWPHQNPGSHTRSKSVNGKTGCPGRTARLRHCDHAQKAAWHPAPFHHGNTRPVLSHAPRHVLPACGGSTHAKPTNSGEQNVKLCEPCRH